MRFYVKIINGKPNLIKQSFYTFKPKLDHITHNLKIGSPILNSIINHNVFSKTMGYGIGSYNGITKIWISPYGDQLEFLDQLNKGIDPFIDIKNYTPDSFPGILHYVGYFVESGNHQIYYYLGNESEHVDHKLKSLEPDYFGYSRTYNSDWVCIKENSYAIRVPYSNCVSLLKQENLINEVDKVPYLNLSYRSSVNADNNEFAVNWLLYDTIKNTNE